MSWRKITMKFPGMCIVCNKKIDSNEIGLWAKGVGVKHERCAEINELKCIVCGGPAGCQQCEFQEDCDRSLVSQLCICKKCNQTNDPFTLYQESVKKKFHLLNIIS
ncbi:MAG: hypothetical protein ACE5RJ_01730 [Nitrosopumilaceae archaeon]